MDLTQLSAPFDPRKVSWRVGATSQDKSSGMALAYIDARDVMERLDRVCGPENWQCRYSHAGQKTICDIGIRIGDEWVWKANGAGDSDVEAEKGASSDAFKRAAVLWGIGRYLYDIKSPWVALKGQGRSYVIANPQDPKLHNALHHALGGPVGGGEAFERTEQAPQRTTNDPQTQEEIGEVLDWTAEALELKRMIAGATQLGYLEKLNGTERFKVFRTGAPTELVDQVRDAYTAKKATYENARAA